MSLVKLPTFDQQTVLSDVTEHWTKHRKDISEAARQFAQSRTKLFLLECEQNLDTQIDYLQSKLQGFEGWGENDMASQEYEQDRMVFEQMQSFRSPTVQYSDEEYWQTHNEAQAKYANFLRISSIELDSQGTKLRCTLMPSTSVSDVLTAAELALAASQGELQWPPTRDNVKRYMDLMYEKATASREGVQKAEEDVSERVMTWVRKWDVDGRLKRSPVKRYWESDEEKTVEKQRAMQRLMQARLSQRTQELHMERLTKWLDDSAQTPCAVFTARLNTASEADSLIASHTWFDKLERRLGKESKKTMDSTDLEPRSTKVDKEGQHAKRR